MEHILIHAGNFVKYFINDCWDYRAEIAHKYPRVALLHGMLGAKMVEVWDVTALYNVFIKEIDIYKEPVQNLGLMLGPGLLGTLGNQHKRQRKMLNPVFSVKHLREMTPLFYQVIHKACAAKDGAELDMLNWSGRTTLEVLGQAGLGVSFDPLTEDRADEFATAVKEFFPQFNRTTLFRRIIPTLVMIGPPSFRRWIVERTPLDFVQQLKRISDVMHNRSVEIFNEKRAALESGDDAIRHQIGEGRDVMSVLLKANIRASEDDKLPDNELIGQVSTMILAGMDTTANSLTRALQLFADRPEAQDRLRQEILQAVETDGDGDTLDYDKIMALPYLEAVCRETLRVYPGVTTLFRVTTKDVILPLSAPIRMRDGTMIDAVPLPKGTEVVPNIGMSNIDPSLWGPDAHVWRPERWLEPLPRAVEEGHVPGVYSHMCANITTFSMRPLTFIGGNRACIGFKFAQVEMKTVLLILLQHFEFKPTGKRIVWNYAGVQHPIVGGPGPDAALPLIVSALRP
ncbi:cytochrome P450 [Ganoderma leucocontextum]|nr:cytochrome P450 [Ganoderma leucocontextum]